MSARRLLLFHSFHVHTSKLTCVHAHAHTHTRAHTYTHARIRTHTHAHARTNTHAHTQTQTHTHQDFEKPSVHGSESHEGINFWDAWRIPGVLSYALCLFFAKLIAYTFLYWLPYYIKSTPIQNNMLTPKEAGACVAVGDMFVPVHLCSLCVYQCGCLHDQMI